MPWPKAAPPTRMTARRVEILRLREIVRFADGLTSLRMTLEFANCFALLTANILFRRSAPERLVSGSGGFAGCRFGRLLLCGRGGLRRGPAIRSRGRRMRIL